jgi:hypothetical protein
MQKSIRLTISIFLSALILLNGSGLVLGKMVCLHSGHTIYKAKALDDCCEKNGKETVIRDKCCAISNVAMVQGNFIPGSLQFLKAPLPVAADFFSVQLNGLFSLRAFSAETHPALSPPENYSRPALSEVCTFRI